MKKIWEWLHGRGQIFVIGAAVIVVLWIVVDFYQGKDTYLSSDKPNPTVSPKSAEEEYIGGDKLMPAAPVAGNKSATAASPEENVGKNNETPQNNVRTAGAQIRLGFAGDICLDDSCAVMRHMRKEGGLAKVISPALIKRMNAYDAMIINNEFSISDRGKKMEGKAYTFRAAPSNVKYLEMLGVDVAGLANNHIYDYGKKAFLDTMKYLHKAGIQTVGAGENIQEAKTPAYLHIKGKTIAIVAATRAEKMIMTPAAGKDAPGVFRTYNDSRYVREIRKAKKKADYVIAYVHWGTEYSTELEDAQKEQAKDYINAGADAVVGAHTHCMQGIGYYKKVPVFYSLGNFWFNEKTLYTTVLEIDIDKEGKLCAKMLPCLQKGKETRLLTKKSQRKKFVKYVNSISTNGGLDKKCNVIER